MCAFWHVLLFCWSLRSRVLLLLVMPMTCVSFYLTDAQLRCEHSGKRHTHMSEQIFLQCLMQTNTVLVFAWVRSVLCTMIALSARLRLLSVWRSQWTILLYYSQPLELFSQNHFLAQQQQTLFPKAQYNPHISDNFIGICWYFNLKETILEKENLSLVVQLKLQRTKRICFHPCIFGLGQN